MNWTTELPGGTRGRVLALAILGIVLTAVWLTVAAPLFDWYAVRAERIAGQRAFLTRMTAMVATLPELERLARAPGTQPASSGNGSSDALQAAALQQRLMRLASNAGIDIASVETLSSERADGIKRIRLRLALRAPWPALLRFLAAIEVGSTAPLLIDDLELRTDATQDDGTAILQAGFAVIALQADATSRTAP
jgi:type II secretory pathway component PulM